MPSVPHLLAADAPVFELPGIRCTGLATPTRGATESSVWFVDVAPGTPGGVHQVTREEVLVALDSRAIASIDGCAYELASGDAVMVPPRIDFSLANPFDMPLRAVAVLPVGGEVIWEGQTFTPPWAR